MEEGVHVPTKHELKKFVSDDVYDASKWVSFFFSFFFVVSHVFLPAASRSKPIEWPETLTEERTGACGTRTEMPMPSVRSFSVKNFLSKQECEALVAATDATGWDQNDIPAEYPEHYRNNQRLITMSPEAAKNLFLRVIFHMTDEELIGVKPMGFNASGVWKPVGLNECFMFTRYSNGQHFSPHYDGHYKDMRGNISIYSVTVYLNSLPENSGGNLIFYKGTRAKPEQISKWRLREGTAVIFNHDVLHEGEACTLPDGEYKYIFRTSIMFEMVSEKWESTFFFFFFF
jgi:predicted 2-oxoglutarate/Fe(II)-dependent dioxygenase YbiX